MMLMGAAFTVAAAWAFGRLLRLRDHATAFVVGAVLLAALTAVCRPGGRPALAIAGFAALIAAARWRLPKSELLPAWPRRWGIALAVVLATFGPLYLLHALMPEVAPDGRFHHLGDVASAWHYGTPLVSPVQLVYLFAFAFGKHTAPTLVHLAFLSALAAMVVAFSRRAGIFKPGIIAAVLVFTSPLAGVTGTTASEDAAVAALLFAAFFLLHERKWTGAAIALVGALLSITQWHGGTPFNGMPGVGFLLVPIALVALRSKIGRSALAAGCATIWLGFLPAMPFIALSIGIALQNTRYVAPLLLAGHALLSWPDFAAWYTPPEWRMGHASVRTALRLRPEAEYLKQHLPGYAAAQLLEQAHGTVYSLAPLPRAYIFRPTFDNPDLTRTLHAPLATTWQQIRLRWNAREASRLTLTGQGNIHEVRFYLDGGELPRSGWRLRAQPDSPTVQNAFDNSPATSWNGSSLEVEFGTRLRISELLIESAQSAEWKLQLDGASVAVTVETTPTPPPPMRRMALYELRTRGIRYLLVNDNDPLTRDLLVYAHVWGVEEVASASGAHLLRLL